jgi:hypothetical protein
MGDTIKLAVERRLIPDALKTCHLIGEVTPVDEVAGP